jgi:hypothetical protein
VIQRLLFKALALALCLLAAPLQSFAAPVVDVVDPITAVWRMQQLEFSLRTGRTLYSCDALRIKIARVLKVVGARDGIEVDLPCRSGGLTNSATAVITFAAPVEATPDTVRAITTYTTEMRLAARLKKVQLPTANDIDRFAAEWRPISLQKQRTLRLDAGDCILIRELAEQVFSKMSVRVDEQRFSCPVGGMTRVRPRIEVMALVSAPIESVAQATERLAP